MQLLKFPFAETNAFNSFFLDYIDQKETLRPFYRAAPAIAEFGGQLKSKAAFSAEARTNLADVLFEQYQSIDIPEAVRANIEGLRGQKTFTVTTGHQLNIATGPLYFIYKIVTVINACRQLSRFYPDYRFVPVYWMASEDHDYEEIKYFRLYGTKYVWETAQKGAVGRFATSGLPELMRNVPGDTTVFARAYAEQPTLAAAVRQYVNDLFGPQGLVVIDADNHRLKKQFANVMLDDLQQHVSKGYVDKASAGLHDLGYKTQVNCRDINLFYLDSGVRERVEKNGSGYKVVDSQIVFTAAEMKSLVETAPEKLSPNVILRPLYQEMILPNLAYVGGPAEVVYWLQLKPVFDHYQIPFPLLMPRNFAMVMDPQIRRKLEKTELEVRDLFEDKNYLFNHWVLTHSPRNLTVGAERSQVSSLFDALKERAGSVDSTLMSFVSAEGKRALNSLEKIERKMLRAEKRLHADRLRQIEFVKDSLFPGGGLQERTDNFLNFYQQDPGFVSTLLECLDPFDYRFNVLMI